MAKSDHDADGIFLGYSDILCKKFPQSLEKMK